MKFSLIFSTLLALLLLADQSSAQGIGITTAAPLQHAAGMIRPPEFDFKPGCRAAEDVESSGSCEADEQAAREQVSKMWDRFSDSDKSMCTSLTESFDPSYVELLSCLEMMRDANVGGGK